MERPNEAERRFLAECAERRQREHSAALHHAMRLRGAVPPGAMDKDAGRAARPE
jgi:hypothetical protein